MAAEATVVVEVIQDQPEAAPRHPGLTAVQQYAQAPEPLGKARAEATAAAVLAHHDRVQRGQAALYDKDRARWAVQKPAPLFPREI